VYLLFLFCFILQLAYLPDRKRDFTDDDISLDSELSLEGKLDLNNPDESVRFDRRNRKRGMLGWFKLKVVLYGH
jgi:centromeric protein E